MEHRVCMTRWSCLPIPILYGLIGMFICMADISYSEGAGMIIVSITSILHHYFADNQTYEIIDVISNHLLFSYFIIFQYHWFYMYGAPITMYGYYMSSKTKSDHIHVNFVHLPTLVMFLMIAMEM